MKPASIDPPEIWPDLWQGFTGAIGWDVGANCGQTVPVMLERFRHVYAFEPAKECWPLLEEHANPRLDIIAIALSDDDGQIDLIELPDKIDTGQLITAGTHGMEWDPDHPDAHVRKVPGRTVDSLIDTGDLPAPDFMKIDVEGHELKVLFGARRTLAVQRPQLLIEFHTENLHKTIKQYLHGLGYDTRTIRHPHYQPGTDMWYGHGWMKCRVPEQGCEPDR